MLHIITSHQQLQLQLQLGIPLPAPKSMMNVALQLCECAMWLPGFMLPDPDDAVIWRGPRKNGIIKQFLKVKIFPLFSFQVP